MNTEYKLLEGIELNEMQSGKNELLFKFTNGSDFHLNVQNGDPVGLVASKLHALALAINSGADNKEYSVKVFSKSRSYDE